MTLLASLLALAAVQSSDRLTLPPIFQAFESVCVGTASVDEAASRARAAGWVEEAPAAGSQLAFMVDLMRGVGAPPVDRTFTAEVDGRRLHMWVRETIPAPMGTFTECKVYDFAPPEPFTIVADALAWQDRGSGTGADPVVLSEQAVGWEGPGGVIFGASIERPPCEIVQPCSPRIVLDQSVSKEH